MPPSKLLVRVDQTKEVKKWLKEFQSLWDEVRDATMAATRPTPKLIPECRSCDYFSTHCLGKGITNSVLSIPKLSKTKIARLSSRGILAIDQLPADFPLTAPQQRAVDCVQTKKPFAADSLRRELLEVNWPAHYLDFESVMTAVPLYPGFSPHQQILTQFSVHHCSGPGIIVAHQEFLADGDRDCERELAERLLADLGTEGSIVVYSSFEATRISALMERFPDLARPLRAIRARLFDLLAVIRRGFYHHEFGGSFSMKDTLPALVPDMSYDGLGIGDGGTAIARFAKMAMARYSADEAKRVRAELLEYCKQDTLAMVKLHERLLTWCRSQ
jgi:hypothetical protein